MRNSKSGKSKASSIMHGGIMMLIFGMVVVSSIAISSASIETSKVKGNVADGIYYYNLGESCSYSSLYITGGDSVYKETSKGSPAYVNEVGAIYYEGNLCTGKEVHGSVIVPNGFSIGNNLNTASAKITMQLYLYDWVNRTEGDGGTLTADIKWDLLTDGDSWNGRSSSTERIGDLLYIRRYNGITKEASISGVVTINGVELTPEYSYGTISSLRSGTVTVYK